MRRFIPCLALLVAFTAAGQSQPPQTQPESHELTQAPAPDPSHDITMVDAAPLGGSIAVPLPERERKKLAKYDIPELVGSRQAIGPQRIDGRLPKPLVDFNINTNAVYERLSIFEGGLVVVEVRGTGGSIRKKLVIPPDALQNYLHAISPQALAAVRENDLTKPRESRHALLRAYDAQQSFVEKVFDPMARLPKGLSDQVVPLQDLLRAVYQDRGVTNSVAGYMPKVGDQLVGDDRKVYKVVRVVSEKIVELRCLSQPTTIYVDVKDLYNYFIGTPGAASR
ncbi:MAG: hypothetical protein QOK37_3313 [Thermoanaerobaculia bacterium]|jgi:hypothetical protein|nr:hypothetical protein [Thermoanaerobaculia bacterium]